VIFTKRGLKKNSADEARYARQPLQNWKKRISKPMKEKYEN